MKRIFFSIAALSIALIFNTSFAQTTANSSASQTNAAGNQAKGEAFLAQNKNADNIHVLPSGLQYQVLAKGHGDSPKQGDTVTLEFKGYLLNGQLFQESKGPETFPMKVFIPGIQQALVLMKPGSKWKLFIPAQLGYGQRGNTKVGPNEVLVINLHLIGINNNQGDKSHA